MDKILYLTMLYDFYGELLTDKQKEFFELYHLNDYSLNEISIEFDISRQAVLNSVTRTEKLLLNYENKLELVEKYLNNKETISSSIKVLESVQHSCCSQKDLNVVISNLYRLLD